MALRVRTWSVRAVTIATLLSTNIPAQAQVPASIGTNVPIGSPLAAPSPGEGRSAGQLRITPWRMSESDLHSRAMKRRAVQPAGRQVSKSGSAKKGLQRAAAGAALGLGGFYLGGIIGARIEGHSCVCDDPGLKGFLIGAPIGAVVGAIIGVTMVK